MVAAEFHTDISNVVAGTVAIVIAVRTAVGPEAKGVVLAEAKPAPAWSRRISEA